MGIAGCPFLIYYGEVSADSDGPIELCRPIARREPTATGPIATTEPTAVTEPTGTDGVQTRIESAHDEVYVRLSKSDLAWPAMRTALDEIEAWATAHDRRPASTFRQVLIADQRTATADTPVCDLSVPLR